MQTEGGQHQLASGYMPVSCPAQSVSSPFRKQPTCLGVANSAPGLAWRAYACGPVVGSLVGAVFALARLGQEIWQLSDGLVVTSLTCHCCQWAACQCVGIGTWEAL